MRARIPAPFAPLSFFDLEADAWFARPWADFARWQTDLARAFEPGLARAEGSGAPAPLNVFSDADGAVVRMLAPGVDPQSIDIGVEGRTLAIRFRHSEVGVSDAGDTRASADAARLTHRELSEGEAARQVVLGFEVDAEHVQASYQAGVLEVRLPKAAAARARNIPVASV